MLESTDLWLEGRYTVAEAATYARLSPQTLRYWLKTGASGPSGRTHLEEVEEGEAFITFLDFVQALAIHAIRAQHKVSLQKIRDAVNRASDLHRLSYPLAREHTTYLLGNDIHIRLPGDDDLTGLTGKDRGQMTMKAIVEVYLKDLSFRSDGLAEQYRAFSRDGIEILMHPRRRYGEPVVASCGYTAYTLWQASIAEGGIEAAAKVYGVQPKEVEVAYRYFDFLSLPEKSAKRGKTAA